MKGRDSGMPDEDYWNSFYDADCVVVKLACADAGNENVVEIGSGYGSFTLPVAGRTTGTVHAFDIEPDLVDLVKSKARALGLKNVEAVHRDVLAEGTGLPDQSMDHAMVYNLLHIDEPVALLAEVCRVLRPGGVLSIIHWIYDPTTPRGPSLTIRPRPEQCRAWAEQAGFAFLRNQDLSECCKYHYGMLLERPHEGGLRGTAPGNASMRADKP